MSDVAKAYLCPICKGVGQIVEFCMEYAARPGTTWEMIHDTSTGSSWCFHCGKGYGSHGAPSDVAARLGVRERDRHLICPGPTGPCAREAGHCDKNDDAPARDHMDERKRAWSDSGELRFPRFKAPEINGSLIRVHPEGSGTARGGTVLTPKAPPAHLPSTAPPKAPGAST